MEEKTARVTLKSKRHIVPDGNYGSPFWVTPSRARALIAAGVVDLVGELPGPTETKPTGPKETKESADDVKDGPSTPTAPSNEGGQEQSSASRPAQASTVTGAGLSAPRKRGPKPKLSR